MLSSLRITDFTLIDRLELTFGAGLNVLTGETGAGKSIILDAIDIVLGGKAGNRAIRQGTRQAIVEATFQMTPEVRRWLEKQEIDLLEENALVVSRDLTRFGDSSRSRSRVNGVVANRQQLAELRELLVEITAQGQTVRLMDETRQRELLDLYGGETLQHQREKVAAEYRTWKEREKIWQERVHSERNRLQRLDILKYQIDELDAAALDDPGEMERLEGERERLSHVVELQKSSYEVYQLLYQNDNDRPAVADLLGEAENILTNMSLYDTKIEPILEMVRSAFNQVVEVGHDINAYGDRLEADPERLGEIEERVALLKRLCRKYGANLEAVSEHERELRREWAELTGEGQSLEDLEKACRSAEKAYRETAGELTRARRETASELEKQLVGELKPLAMEKVIFVCQIAPTAPTNTGLDRVEFYFSPNPGEKIQPLSATASGGEMSRFLLALQACFSKVRGRSGTLIFDEIDVGVSGKVAGAIAEKLHQLSRGSQVLCVTHQPLVAAMADRHFRVDKLMIEERDPAEGDIPADLAEIRTVVRVTTLDNRKTRREELAQLAGGQSAADALAFAESLLVKAEGRKG